MYSKYSTLTLTQLISITILSFITVSGTFMRLSMDKNVETSTFANGLLIKGVTSAAIIFIGITFFNEKYTWKTWLAIVLIATGIYLLN
jgi:multidrug transporter EmrE-like cation transporter